VELRDCVIDGRLAIRVTPRASRDRVVIDGGSVRAYVTAAPEDGKANAAAIALVAKALGVPKSAVTLLRGSSARDKLLAINP
jgi:uncharacterized protein YggU (UPF0235/DUF167 family)